MSSLNEAKGLLQEMENETGVGLWWAAAPPDISGRLQLNVYPNHADAEFRYFDVSNGWTPKVETDIVCWIGSFLYQQ